MSKLRRWRLDATQPLALTLAADARLSSTDYADDQVWRLLLGTGDDPALALQTRYGARTGLASLVPMWRMDARTIYQSQAYTAPPVITAFAPGYLQAEGRITARLALRAEYWALASHVIGGQFTLGNTGTQPLTVRFDLFGHVVSRGREQRLGHLSLTDSSTALYLGINGNLHPVVLVENGTVDPASPSGRKLGATLTVPPDSKVAVRWVQAARPNVNNSVNLARRWLKESWTLHMQELTTIAAASPNIETGDDEIDATLAFAYREALQSFLRPTSSLPYSSFVTARQPDHGFSRRRDGSDHPRSWSGQTPTAAYLLALAIAPVDSGLAQGIVRNYLAVQQADGWIDWKPGLGGQQSGLLCLPLLARLTWGIFQYTEDEIFLGEVFPGLLKFFQRWQAADLDHDGDGIPEWQNQSQTGFPFMPTFAIGLPWGQQADIRTVETPDLLAYLLSEAVSLREIAYYLRLEEERQQLDEQVTRLKTALESLWHDGRYHYRDRDTHVTAEPVTVVERGYGDEEHIPALPLDPPGRLIVTIEGGSDHIPTIKLHLHGTDANGEVVEETVGTEAFVWMRGRGVYTSRAVFGKVDRVSVDGLVRVYRVTVKTPDTTRLDLNALLPLWSVGIPAEHSGELIRLLTDPQHFWRPGGVPMCSAQDAAFDSANARGTGGVWTFWLTLMGEGLIEAGESQLATDLFKRLLTTQVAVLKQHRAFTEFYNSDEPVGLGELGHSDGIVPLHLLLRVLGVRIVSARKVWTGGKFAWGDPVTITQFGVRVRRSPDGTTVEFPSGRKFDLPADAPWSEIIDSD